MVSDWELVSGAGVALRANPSVTPGRQVGLHKKSVGSLNEMSPVELGPDSCDFREGEQGFSAGHSKQHVVDKVGHRITEAGVQDDPAVDHQPP